MMVKRISNREEVRPLAPARVTRFLIFGLVGLVAAALATPIGASTPKPMTLAEVKRASASIVLGKVVDLRVQVLGSNPDFGRANTKQSIQPATEYADSRNASESSSPVDKANLLPDGSESFNEANMALPFEPTAPTQGGLEISSDQAPESLGTEGGMMLLTEVSMSVEKALGTTDMIDKEGELRFTVAGGVLDDFSVIVHGMPDLAPGGRYIVFLHDNLQERGDPYVGLGQGVFPIVVDPETGRDIVTNLSGSPVIGIEEGRVIVRASEEDRREFNAMMSPPPTSMNKNDVIRSSVQESRFWSSQEPALHTSDFMELVEGL